MTGSPRRRGRPGPPVRLVHLGLGNFFRAHAAAFTDDVSGSAADRADWGFAAFGGRLPGAGGTTGGSGAGSPVVATLAAQGGCYTLLERGPERDRASTVASVSEVHPASDLARWRSLVASPAVVAVTLTVTEAGYGLGPDGRADRDRRDRTADLVALQAASRGSDDRTTMVRTVAGRLVDGLRARRDAGAGPVAVIPCDNLPGNGWAVSASVLDLAGDVDPSLAAWIHEQVSFVSTVVDRITPRATAADLAAARALTGWDDPAVVVTEPYREWVLAGAFPAGRPSWEHAGAVFVDDVTPYEARKLLWLNGAHSLVAYLGLALGHATVASALANDQVAGAVEAWWDEAAPSVPLAEPELAGHRDRLRARFANPRLAHRLAQIAEDGSQKLPRRVLPVLRANRLAGRSVDAAVTALGAWVVHVRGVANPGDLRDAEARRLLTASRSAEPTRALLEVLGPDLADDGPLVDAVADRAAELGARGMPGDG